MKSGLGRDIINTQTSSSDPQGGRRAHRILKQTKKKKHFFHPYTYSFADWRALVGFIWAMLLGQITAGFQGSIKTCIRMFISVLFIIKQDQKQSIFSKIVEMVTLIMVYTIKYSMLC